MAALTDTQRYDDELQMAIALSASEAGWSGAATRGAAGAVRSGVDVPDAMHDKQVSNALEAMSVSILEHGQGALEGDFRFARTNAQLA